jgi:hypothetical protein
MPLVPGGSAFDLNPHLQEERLQLVDGKKRIEIMKCDNATMTACDDQGSRVTFPSAIDGSESVMAALREPWTHVGSSMRVATFLNLIEPSRRNLPNTSISHLLDHIV